MEIETTLAALFLADPEPLLNHREPAHDDRSETACPSTWHFWAERFTSEENQLFDTGLADRMRHRAVLFVKHFAHSPKAKPRHAVPLSHFFIQPLGREHLSIQKKRPNGGNE